MLWSILKTFTRRPADRPVDAPDKSMVTEGIERFNAGDFAAASRHLSAACAADPDDIVASYYFALAEARCDRLEHAQKMLEELCLQRDDADFNNALGNVRRLRGFQDEAVASYRRAVELEGTHLSSLANLGLALRDQGVPLEAITVLDRALGIAPDHVEALFNKALALVDLGESKPACELIERVLTLDPTFAQAHLQRGFMLLKRGDFATGWREYAWRVRIPEMDHWQNYAFPLWQGETLSGRRVLVQAEQGLGDQIMFASCVPELIESAAHTIIECDPRLARLFARSFPSAVIYRHRVQGEPDWSNEPATDYRMRLGDLPRMLRNHEADFPVHDGYLLPDAGKMAAWRARLDALGPGLKVGLSWRGGTPNTGQAMRSIALDALLPILSLQGVHFISLQYGRGVTDEIAALRARHGVVVHAWSDGNADMDGVAALISSLDIVVTVCTTAAHLSGALGKSALVMVPAVAEWRYGESGAQIPWYPALRLFRQQNSGAWGDVIFAVAAELAGVAGSS
jgi:Tfp pilus assembly protein PilF